MSETRAVLRGVRLSVDKGPSGCRSDPWQKVDQALNIPGLHAKKAAGIIKRFWSRPSPTQNTTMVPISTN